MQIKLKRAYEKPSPEDGYRLLVDRLWPRGVSKEEAAIDQWSKEIAPSPELRQWFGHNPEKWQEFKKRYLRELAAHKELVAAICRPVKQPLVTLVYAAKDTERNNAVVLKEYLENDKKRRSP